MSDLMAILVVLATVTAAIYLYVDSMTTRHTQRCMCGHPKWQHVDNYGCVYRGTATICECTTYKPLQRTWSA